MKKTKSEIELAISIGENIRRVRTHQAISVNDIAEILKITRVAYGNIESGKTDITLSRLIKLCKILEIPVHEIVHHEMIPSLDQAFEDLTKELRLAQKTIISLQNKLLRKEASEDEN